ncbi:unnamed protein product [Penicillium nalgiovense]|uniref:Uncharacterized protein n=1 Tax=Penicillium nalgiovense TaxID=60175 RepID=A0A9W4HUY7_PENNA|nr:unnamed protein product [Penicillium nalgiovense]CAG8025911.1 unnamed protein product [Penicillium nalgiovense]CAG8067901.1 unnamed protein product [Penicillium nalgiovense]CAG8079412.1 unnamed protein product [Penicillium nalgiovense]CAG8085923.1 unnamed protein product [Penicillium nalgiovense]
MTQTLPPTRLPTSQDPDADKRNEDYLPPLLTPRASPNPEATRGSYRFLPTPEKRSRADYKGLDMPSRKKKKRNKAKSNKATTKDMAQEADNAVAVREGDISAEPLSTTKANVAMSIP